MYLSENDSEDHKILSDDAIKELEMSQSQKSKIAADEIKAILLERLKNEEACLEDSSVHLLDILNFRKAELISTIEEIYLKAADEILSSKKKSIASIEREVGMIDSDESQLLKLIKSKEHAKSIGFSDLEIPQKNIQLPQLIKNELNIKLNFYESGVPKFIYYFQPSTKNVKLFNLFSDKESVMQVSFKCKDYPSICFGPQGKILYTGGWDSRSTNDCYLIDTILFESVTLPRMNETRYQHASIYASDCYYIFGGIKTTIENPGQLNQEVKEIPIRTCEKWNGHEWELLNCKLTKDMFMCGICERDGKIYLTGRQHIEIFVILTQSFTTIQVNWPRRLLSLIVNSNDRIIIFRGNTVGQIDSSNLYYVISPAMEVEWWSSSPLVTIGNDIYCYLDSKRTVYSFNYESKKISELYINDY